MFEALQNGASMTPSISFVRESEDLLPDPYLLLATAKQHLADHRNLTWGDRLAWELIDRVQTTSGGRNSNVRRFSFATRALCCST